ncbi:MAG: hypothetical protein ACE5KF_09520, partial [Kiloniellaceae bacterium]
MKPLSILAVSCARTIVLGAALGAAAPSGALAAADSPDPGEVIGYRAADRSGPSKSWRLPAEKPYLYVPYVGDEVEGAISSVRAGGEVGVALFQRPYFTSKDVGCTPDLGTESRPDLKWLGPTARFAIPPGGQATDAAVDPTRRARQYASLIIFRKTLGPPPGALLLERRRTIGTRCPNPAHKISYNRLFVPMSEPPEATRCFDLAGSYAAEGSENIVLNLTRTDRLVLLAPSDLDDRYRGIRHRFTVTAFDGLRCQGNSVSFKSAARATGIFKLADFGFRDQARSLRITYEGGALAAYLAPPDTPPQVATAEPAPAPAPGTAEKAEAREAAMPKPALPKAETGPSVQPGASVAAGSVPVVPTAVVEAPPTAAPGAEAEPVHPEAAGAEAEPVRPEAAGAEAEPVQPEPAGAEIVRPAAAGAEIVRPAAAGAETVRPEIIRIETVQSATARTE